MNVHSSLPEISSYISLIESFIGGSITAVAFEKAYLHQMKNEARTFGDPVYPILQELFEDVDAFVERPELRSDPDDLDKQQLTDCAVRARQQLRDIGFD